MEFGGEAGGELVSTWMPLILQAAGDFGNQDICQTAVYGIGLCAEFAPKLFLPFANQSLSGLSHIIKATNKKKKKQAQIMENAISSLGRIILANAASLDVPSLLCLWLSGLPVSKDEKECTVIHSQLCQFLILFVTLHTLFI